MLAIRPTNIQANIRLIGYAIGFALKKISKM